jgi:hypothetical protein
MIGAACATGGGAGGGAGGCANGVGLAIVAPGVPVPGTSGAGATVSGAVRLRACENAWTGKTQSSANTSALQRQKTPNPRPMVFFSVPITAFSSHHPSYRSCVEPSYWHFRRCRALTPATSAAGTAEIQAECSCPHREDLREHHRR